MGNDRHILCVDEWPDSAVVCGSGLGSSLLKLPAYHDARRMGFDVSLVTSAAKVELLRFCPVFNQLMTPDQLVDCTNYDLLISFGIEKPEDRVLRRMRGDFRVPEEVKHEYNLVPHIQYWRRLMADLCGFKSDNSRAQFDFQAPEFLPPQLESLPGRYLVVSLSALSDLKRYPNWGSVIERLSDAGFHLVLVGMEAPKKEFSQNSVTNLTRQTSISDLVAIVAHSQAVLGTDGLVTNLGMVCRKPVVNLFTIISPDFVLDPQLTIQNPIIPLTASSCPLQPCYQLLSNYRHDPCPLTHDPRNLLPLQCTDFDPAAVVGAVERLFAEAD